MQTKLTAAERLKDLRVSDRKLTLEELAEQTGLSRSALSNYEKDGGAEISPYAVTRLAKFYGVSSDYLLGLTENKNHPNTALSELHLSDSAIDILTSGTLNPRLLSELICHPAFRRFLIDTEICVDRIADMRLKDMNLILNQTRQTILDRYHPREDDLPLRTLELAQLNDEMFYSHVLHSDLDVIVRDIRAAHEQDLTTAEDQTPAEATKADMALVLNEALNYEGTIDEKRAVMICRSLKINYDKLTEEEQSVFARVCKKSPIFANFLSQRGKGVPMTHGQGKKRSRHSK